MIFRRAALITAQESRLDTKKQPLKKAAVFTLEAPPRFELGHKGFADLCLTTWLWRLITEIKKRLKRVLSAF